MRTSLRRYAVLLATWVATALAGPAATDVQANEIRLGPRGGTVGGDEVVRALVTARAGDVVIADSMTVVGAVRASVIDTVRGSLQFRSTRFTAPVLLDRNVFLAGIDFEASTFLDTANFSSCFYTGADFEDATFEGHARFIAYFMVHADFRGARFAAPTEMYAFACDGVAIFERASFEDDLSIGDSRFRMLALFKGASFADVSFGGGNFHELAHFRNASFTGITDFKGSSFRHRADFRGTDFTGSRLLLRDAYVDKGQFDSWEQIAASLALVEEAERGPVPLARAHDMGEVAKLLALIESGFARQGQIEEEHAAYYAGRQIRRRAALGAMDWDPRTWWEPTKATLIWISCGYGVRPQYTLLLGLVVILICTVSFYPPEAIHMDSEQGSYRTRSGIRSPRKRLRDAFYFSVTTFTTVGYGDWYPKDNSVTIGRWKIPFLRYRTIAMLEGVIGWILITVFVISLGFGKTWIIH